MKFLTLVTLLIATAPTLQAKDFIEGFPDIPNPPKMVLVDKPILFDTAAGLVGVADFSGKATAATLWSAYRPLLVAAGWHCIQKGNTQPGHHRCIRDNSLISLVFTQKKPGDTRLKVKVEPT